MILTPKEQAAMRSFDRWTRSLFNNTKPCFSARFHQEPDHVLLNRGTMQLFREGQSYTLVDISQGARIIVIHGRLPLSEVLLRGLDWCVRQQFVNTYQEDVAEAACDEDKAEGPAQPGEMGPGAAQ